MLESCTRPDDSLLNVTNAVIQKSLADGSMRKMWEIIHMDKVHIFSLSDFFHYTLRV